MKTAQVAIVFFALLLCTGLTQSENILAICFYSFRTPYLAVVPYIKALIGHGHNVTLISSVGLLPDIEGVRHIRVPNIDMVVEYIMNCEFNMDFNSVMSWKWAIYSASFYYNITNAILSDSGVQSMLNDESEHFDLVLMEPTFSDSLIGFAEHYNAPLVGLAIFGSSWLTDYYTGNSAPSVYRPVSAIGYSPGDSLIEKWNNWIHIVEEWMLDRFVNMPLQLELFRRHFHYSADTFYKRRKTYSLMLINQHFSLGRSRSNYPNTVEVAGMHLAEPIEPLEPELVEFLNGAEHGIIYFSMGMEILSKYLPESMEQKMLKAFSQLKQRIVWKHDTEAMLNKSDNVYLSPMPSQRLLLEHPNTKLFITHGGLLSTIEAANSAVPLLGFPIYFDQFDNMERMKQVGVARIMDFNTFTVEQLIHNIRELIQNPYYTLKSKELSARFRDQPTSPLERAVWWTEYVLRHKGAPYMRVDEHDMSFIHYYGIQFFTIIFGRILFTALVLIIAAVMIIKCILNELDRFYQPPMLYNELRICQLKVARKRE